MDPSPRLSFRHYTPRTLALSRAGVLRGRTAEEHYREAVECFGRTALRTEHARSHLLYGEWLRRENRRIDAREQLRRAYDLFYETGMLAFVERARHELRATGEGARKRQPDTPTNLTPQRSITSRRELRKALTSRPGRRQQG